MSYENLWQENLICAGRSGKASPGRLLGWDGKEERSEPSEGEMGRMLMTEGISCAKALR